MKTLVMMALMLMLRVHWKEMGNDKTGVVVGSVAGTLVADLVVRTDDGKLDTISSRLVTASEWEEVGKTK